MRRLLLAQVWAFLLCLPQLAAFNHPGNRYLLFWSSLSAPLYFGCVAALGFALWPLLRWRWTTPLLAVVLLAGEARSCGWLMLAAFGLALGCLAVAASRWNLPRFAERALFFISPIVPLYWGMLFLAPTFEEVPRVDAVETRPAPPAGDTWIFILDAWSSRLEMPRIAALSREATVFTDAHAPSCATMQSLPRFLFQRDDSFALRGNELGFWDGSTFRPCRELETIFDRPGSLGHRTVMIGWYHQYPRMLDVDRAYTTNGFRWLGDSAFDLARQFYHDSAQKLLKRSVIRSTALHTLNRSFVRQTDDVMRELWRVIEEPGPTFAVFHLPLPHYPFCYGPQGLLDLREEYPLDSEELARSQHLYTDRVVGDILDRLRELGRFDDATIVLTSDHTWRDDPTLKPDARIWSRVPCIVKLPGQREKRVVGEPFTTSRLVRWLEAGAVEYVSVDSREADPKWPRPIVVE